MPAKQTASARPIILQNLAEGVPELPIAPDATFGTRDVNRIFPRLSLRQLQWMDEKRVLRPSSKDGHKRHYTIAELIILGVVDELYQRKYTPTSAGLFIRVMQGRMNRWRDGYSEYPLGEYLMVNHRGKHAFFGGPEALAEVASELAWSGSDIIATGAVIRHVRDMIEKNSRPSPRDAEPELKWGSRR
jgi:hypothetical protein